MRVQIAAGHWPFSVQFQHSADRHPNLLYIFNEMAIINLQNVQRSKKWPNNF